MLYMVTCTINIPTMLAYIPYVDPMGLACTAGDPPDFLQGSSQLAVVVLCRGRMGDRWKSTLQFQRLVALSTMTGWLYHPVSWDDDIPNTWKVIKFMFQTTNQLWMLMVDVSIAIFMW